MIVGFPNETDDDFEETMDTLKKIHFTKIHTFPYSRRRGTVADKMDGHISGDIKKKEFMRLLNYLMNMKMNIIIVRLVRYMMG